MKWRGRLLTRSAKDVYNFIVTRKESDMGRMKELLFDVAEELYPDDSVAQDKFMRDAVAGELSSEERIAVERRLGVR